MSLRLDSELSEFEERLLEVHLGRCAACRDFAERLAAVTTAVRAAPPEEVAFSLSLRTRYRPWNRARGAISAAAAVAAVSVSALVAVQLSTAPLSTSPISTSLGHVAAVDRELLTFKERLLEQRESMRVDRTRPTPRGVLSARNVTLGDLPRNGLQPPAGPIETYDPTLPSEQRR